jgi:CheY-like chemotaxis protein
MDEGNDWIAKRAYSLWEEAGRPFGQDELHWTQAAKEHNLLRATHASSDGREVLERRRDAPDTVDTEVSQNVLVVEDEPQLRFDTVDNLERAGLRTFEAANADEAIVLMKNHEVDVLITDIDMPGSMDGLGLVATVRSRWPTTRIIVTSGLIKLTHRDLDEGVVFVAKPAGSIEFLKLIAG